MGTNEDGLTLPAIRAGDGSYHVIGSLTTVPPTTIKNTLELGSSLGKQMSNAWVILVCPTPCYVKMKCSSNPEHIDNSSDTEYGVEVIDHQDQHRRLLGVGGGGGILSVPDYVKPGS
jgi:hypothetical protein